MTAEETLDERSTAEESSDGAAGEARDSSKRSSDGAAGDTDGSSEFYSDGVSDRERVHLSDVEDGAGCTEIWEHLSERRESDEE